MDVGMRGRLKGMGEEEEKEGGERRKRRTEGRGGGGGLLDECSEFGETFLGGGGLIWSHWQVL